MTYEEFKIIYLKTYNLMMKYTPEMAGAGIYAEQLANLSDEYPEFEEAYEDELFEMEVGAK